MPLPPVISMSLLEALLQDTLNLHAEILLARAYHDGIQPVYLTDRQKEYLDLHKDNQFSLNVTRTVVIALRDELNVVGFDTGEAADEQGIKKQARWLWDIWKKNRMDARQGEFHEDALRDSEVFMILDWDTEKKIPTMILHERFTHIDAEAWQGRWTDLQWDTMQAMKGTGCGVWAIYENDDPNQEMVAAVQQWNEITFDEKGGVSTKIRRTIYYPDRIERFEFDNGWTPLENSPQAWLDENKKPLGIPVVHFKNENMRPEAWDAIPPQDAVNKTYVDILGTMDLSGFAMFVALGIYPTDDGQPPAADGSNVWKVGPAQWVGNAMKNASEASVQKFDGSDPTPLMNTLKDQIVFIAEVTSTPTSRFIMTAQVASDQTQKEQERPFKKKVYNRQILFGEAWEEAMRIARAINNAFGTEKIDPEVSIHTIWKNIETVDDLKSEQELGVPQETLWAKSGYTQDQIANMKKTPEYRLKFLTNFWTAYNLVSASGQTVEEFAKAVGLGTEEIKLVTSLGTDTIPPTQI